MHETKSFSFEYITPAEVRLVSCVLGLERLISKNLRFQNVLSITHFKTLAVTQIFFVFTLCYITFTLRFKVLVARYVIYFT